jgi:N-acetylglucosaminyl-diphospho-decaprenol L-rhamnosyltransferase
MSVAPRVSVLVVSYNAREYLLNCLESLESTLPLEIIVVDNGSTDGSSDAVRLAFPRASVIASRENLGFARANNLALRQARAPYVLILNPDAEVRPGAVEAMARLLDEDTDVGVVGPRTVGSDGSPQVSFGPSLGLLAEWRQRRLVDGVRKGRPGALARALHESRREHEPGWVSGSCMLARRSALDSVGSFDEVFFLYEEDVDLCVRLKEAGWRIVYTPKAEVVHHLGRSMASSPFRARLEYHRSHLRYYAKHQGAWATLLLRLYILSVSAVSFLRALGPGGERRARRAHHAAVFSLALRPQGLPSPPA